MTFPAVLADYLRRFGWLAVASDEFYGLGTDVPSHLDLVKNAKWEREQSGCPLPRNLIPIYNDGAGNLACVDVDSAHGRIAFWDHDGGDDQEPDEVATSLDAWLAGQIATRDASDAEPKANLRAFFAELPKGLASEPAIDDAIARQQRPV